MLPWYRYGSLVPWIQDIIPWYHNEAKKPWHRERSMLPWWVHGTTIVIDQLFLRASSQVIIRLGHRIRVVTPIVYEWYRGAIVSEVEARKGSRDDPGSLVLMNLQPGSRSFQPGSNPGATTTRRQIVPCCLVSVTCKLFARIFIESILARTCCSTFYDVRPVNS